MNAIITSFRRGRRTVSGNQMIIKIQTVDSKDKATALIGKVVSWKSPAGKELKGKISAAHGNNGSVRAIFETGMPGQALGAKVSLQ